MCKDHASVPLVTGDIQDTPKDSNKKMCVFEESSRNRSLIASYQAEVSRRGEDSRCERSAQMWRLPEPAPVARALRGG